LLSVAARTWLLVHRPLWFDELFTIWASRLTLPRLLEILKNDSGPPLWYVLEKPFVLAGERLFSSDNVARVLPFLATLALFGGASALPSRRAKTRYLLLVAASPLLLLYSAEARAYGFLSMICFALFLLGARGSESPRRLLAIALLSAVALYTHYLALFAVGALVVVAAAEKRIRSAVATLAGGLTFLFWIPVMARQPRGAVAWMHETPFELVTGILSSLGGSGDIPHPFGPPLPDVLLGAGIALALAIGVALAMQWRHDADLRRVCAFLVLFFGGVLFASLARPIAFSGRTELAVLPVWLWAVALAGERSRVARIASRALLLLAAASSAILLCSPRNASPSARAIELLERSARAGDVLFAGAQFYLPARLASDRHLLGIPVEAFPREQATHPGWTMPRWPRPEDLQAVERALDRANATGRVYFLVPPSYRVPLRPILSRRGVIRRLGETREVLFAVWTGR
jgi:hypothetical protein